ncbi:MAG: TonB-dependent receptor [candidate division WOR-3 bacterium]
MAVKKLPILIIILPAIGFASRIKGFVKDQTTGEPIELVNVYLENTPYGGATNREGYYLIDNIPDGNYTIVFSYLGYKTERKTVNIQNNTVLTLNMQLVPEPIEIGEVRVSARRTEFEKKVKTSSIRLSNIEIKNPPAVIQDDLFRSLQALPGIVSTSDFSTALYVRGGNADQNLILLDGASIYNPGHLAGIFSVFDPDAVKSVELLAGGFPAEFGGRLSSVLDITTREGNKNRLAGSIAPGILGTKVLVEGPLPKGSFLTFFRRTYFDKVLKLVGIDFPYYFYDFNAKAIFELGQSTKLSLTGFVNTDHLDFGTGGERVNLIWGNRMASLLVNHIFNPKLLNKTYFTFNHYLYDMNIASNVIRVKDWVQEFTLKSDFTCLLNKNNELGFGFEGHIYGFRYNDSLFGGFNYDIYGTPYYFAIYCQTRYRPFDKLIIEPGLRVEDYFLHYKQWHNYLLPGPRLGIKYFLGQNTALKLALGKYYQFVSALIPDFNPIPSLFFWVPVFGDYRPLDANHYIFGFEHWFTNDITLTLETYYKHYYRIYTMSDTIEAQRIEETMFQQGTGNSYGIDLLLKKDFGKISGWLAYSLGYAQTTFGKATYSPNYDRRHMLNLIGRFALPKGFYFSARWEYGSGLPYTEVIARMRRWDLGFRHDRHWFTWQEIMGNKNGSRYPDYQRLDIGIERNFRIRRIDLQVSFQIINVYNHKNLFFYYYDYDYEPPPRKAFYMLPILPTLGIKIDF